MKKSLLALAVLGSFAGTSFAQSSVTIYGLVDVAYVHDSGSSAAGSFNKLESGQSGSTLNKSGSRLGFKGTEDLGDGLAAIYTLEQGINVDTGTSDQGGTTFGRQAWVGLQSKDIGAVKLGRQYNPLYNTTVSYDPFGAGMAGAYTRIFSVGGGPNGKRVNNAITYLTPSDMGGFKAELLYALGEVAGDNSQLREAGFSVSYANGPISVGAAYHNANSAIVAPATTTNATKNSAAGASYDFGVVKASLLYESTKNDTNTVNARDWLAGVSAPFGASTVLLSYIRHDDKTLATNGNSNQIALGYNYDLSKRTSLYTAYSRLANDSAAKLGVPTLGATDKLFVAGLNHKF